MSKSVYILLLILGSKIDYKIEKLKVFSIKKTIFLFNILTSISLELVVETIEFKLTALLCIHMSVINYIN